MSIFDLQKSIALATKRLGKGEPTSRKSRSDRGKMRLDPKVRRHLDRALSGNERSPMRAILGRLERFCEERGLTRPCRATVYRYMETALIHRYEIPSLPRSVRAALYNLGPEGKVPGHQLAFYCFNYGDLEAISFGAGLPWLDIYQAKRMRGFRPRSRGLIEAVARVRRI